jgi:integrase
MRKPSKPYPRTISANGCVRWYVRHQGREQWLGKDETEALANWERLKAGKPIIRERQRTGSVGELMWKYLDWVKVNQPEKYDRRRAVVRCFAEEFGEHFVSKLTTRAVTSWLSLQSRPDIIRKTMRSVFRRLVEMGLIDRAPIKLDATIGEIVDEFLAHAQTYYRKLGKVTSQVAVFRSATTPLKELYGDAPATEFTCVKLEKVRDAMIDRGWCRTNINQHVGRIRRVFKFAAKRQDELALVWSKLLTLDPLLKGRSEAVEAEPVKPVDDAVVDATLPHVTPIVADMIRVQRLTGMRPGEVTSVMWAEVDTSGDVWIYRPTHHKTEHHDIARVIMIGARAQAILSKYLGFGPVFPGRRKGRPFTTPAYRRCITRGCERAFGMPKELQPSRKAVKEMSEQELETIREKAEVWRAENCWAPNQLRHSFATELRKTESLDVVAAALGHTKIETSQLYAENDLAAARAVVARIG